ncbi:hypothetical protein [Streptomyces palmae]|uniref:Uncharacterized protein n=1 Tax=Streptomyces palmae TaxID=1701085 RepID=A0A4Z0H701_9ACTN|nr:hypothetical protein [Streptomyces palmae]TGB09064.1 hypothetical protein E4099_14375 [Streptomyces palmae]
MEDRTLGALGFGAAPREEPLCYPGRPVTTPMLLCGDVLWPLEVRPGPPGGWAVTGPGGPEPLDALLARLGQRGSAHRCPVLAVGSNASPAQLRHKLARRGIGVAVPLVPVRVRGISVGVSAHIGPAGYVPTAPFPDPGAERELVVCWFDEEQLRVVDAGEFGYRRPLLSGSAVPLLLPSGERLPGAYLYESGHGVLAGPDGLPRPGGGDQAALLTALLAGSARLRALLGPDPRSWVRRVRAQEAVGVEGTRILAAEGWRLRLPGLGTFQGR